MRILLIEPASRAKIARVVEYAEANRIPFVRLQRMATGREAPIGDDPEFACVVPQGYRCVFSIEEQPKWGWSRHLSISVPGHLYPHPAAVDELAKEFGFDPRRDKVRWLEKEVRAVNVLQPLKGWLAN